MQTVLSRLQDAYPQYSARLLDVIVDDYLAEAAKYLERTKRGIFDLPNMFTTEPVAPHVWRGLEGRRLACMSLYFKAPSVARWKFQPKHDSQGQIPRDELERADHPIWEGTSRAGKTFFENYLDKVLESDFRDWRPVVFLARDLAWLSPMLAERGWTVISMRHDGIAECPGAMWRYLSLNSPAQCVYIQDTDRKFNSGRANRLADLLEKNPASALARPLQWTSGGGEMSMILGNDFAARPSAIDFDAAKMMLGYIILNILHEDRVTNFCFEPQRGRDDRNIAPLSARAERPLPSPLPHERVPNKNFPFYAFDEQWLREFVYYHLSDGRLITLVRNERSDDRLQQLDLALQRLHGNILVQDSPQKPGT